MIANVVRCFTRCWSGSKKISRGQCWLIMRTGLTYPFWCLGINILVRLIQHRESCSIGSMMTSSNGNIFRVTGTLCGEFTGHRWIPSQRPVTRSFDAFFDPRLNKRLSKQAWLETPSRSLWRQCNVIMSSGLLHPWYIPCRINRLLCPPMEGSRQPAPPQCWKNIENAFILGFLKTIQHLND